MDFLVLVGIEKKVLSKIATAANLPGASHRLEVVVVFRWMDG